MSHAPWEGGSDFLLLPIFSRRGLGTLSQSPWAPHCYPGAGGRTWLGRAAHGSAHLGHLLSCFPAAVIQAGECPSGRAQWQLNAVDAHLVSKLPKGQNSASLFHLVFHSDKALPLTRIQGLCFMCFQRKWRKGHPVLVHFYCLPNYPQIQFLKTILLTSSWLWESAGWCWLEPAWLILPGSLARGWLRLPRSLLQLTAHS